eukprot:CAMPEP_0201476390 /NCGR_PEP_ID=MMETSP0151_2-20130828/1596_1 /ASSEMBLY_ACC=CAM_ASM_000257 /TAXON_ID=200890 /ORGANISM="Paramoeba atlantica, Strain 621/1 / CCAP 1560/9" /LENGTH=153 /DNA_ID=CAMNT_0047856731 /DNA_START=76 /DNA_END=537 /DNA_ORIENTATION=+
MAGQSTKKLLSSNWNTWRNLFLAFLASLLFHLSYDYYFDLFETRAAVDQGMLYSVVIVNSVLLFLLYTTTSYDIAKEGFYPYYCDVIMVSTATLFLAVLSPKFWLIMLTVPAYLGYKIIGFAFSFQNAGMPSAPEPEDKKDKKKVKKIKVRRK